MDNGNNYGIIISTKIHRIRKQLISHIYISIYFYCNQIHGSFILTYLCLSNDTIVEIFQ